ncbi:MAG TPA: RNA polymerase-binding protein DksA [Bdellovibrionales bacterium]|nr:RNA polymerase-binding protein DksA [Bdellovibrionales bacterium]HCM40829.1 RNA polymerase-binding protein DksA [Bdellovibrionales bacterium]
MTISKEKLEIFRKQLLARRDALRKELSIKTAQLLDDEDTFADAVDQASAETDKAISVSMKNRDEGLLTQLDEALRRIDAGAFGSCRECGESISEGRLQAFPMTTLCIDCKAELESEKQRFPGRS